MRAAGNNSAVVVRAKLVGWLGWQAACCGACPPVAACARGAAAGVAEASFGPPEHARPVESEAVSGLPVRAEPAAA
eukprot:scaffold129549_cov39-Phaeocystis_antarctica.AAC.1